MRVHLPSLPHTETTREYDWCAYTAKVRRFADMLMSLGHEVIVYAGEKTDAACTEHVTIVHTDEQDRWWPGWNPETSPWPDGWDPSSEWWKVMNHRAVAEIELRSEPGDFLGIIGGACQQFIANALPSLRTVEWGIGYKGVFAPFRVYESYAWMHHVYGREHREHGQAFDAVIPNSFHPSEVTFDPDGRQDYLLYMGRMIPEKGLSSVAELAKAGYRVVTAGQGDERVPGAQHLGVVRGEQKRMLLAQATAVLVPTNYIEPFGGVAVEAMMSGTPVITTDWGAFTETVDHGVMGFRCRVRRDFIEAAEKVRDLDVYEIRDRAHARWSTAVVAQQYDDYLHRLLTLDGEGWYA